MTAEVEMGTNGRPDEKPKRFFVYCKVDHPNLIGKECPYAPVVEQGGSIVDEALDVSPNAVVDMPGYARLYDALNGGAVDAFVTDMTVFGPTMILGLCAMCAASGVEMSSPYRRPRHRGADPCGRGVAPARAGCKGDGAQHVGPKGLVELTMRRNKMMTERKIVETFLPAFSGFYQSHWVA